MPRPRSAFAVRLLGGLLCSAAAALLGPNFAGAVDQTFNISLVGQSNPTPGRPFFYGDVWASGNYAYVGSDRTGGGISIFNIANPFSPQFLTMYPGDEMEDVEVYNGIGYFGSDVNVNEGTGVDIVDLHDPANPVRLSRINGASGGHNKVHTLSVSNGYLYTADNATDVIKIFNVTNPISPQFVASVDLGLPAGQASHEVMALNGRLFVASKDNNSNTCCGTTAIYDVSNLRTGGPVLMKRFDTGARSHTSMVSPDGKTLVVAQERSDGQVRIYDISNINQANDPDTPVLLSTLTRTSVGIDAYSPHHPMIHGDLLFMAWYEAGLQVFNIANPANPIRVGSYDTYPGTSTNYNGDWGVFPMLGINKVLLSDRTRGLIIVDATETAPTGDLNYDGSVDGADFLVWQQGLGATNATTMQGDGNRDKLVNGLDLAVWKQQFGQTGGHAAAAVPESASIALAAPILLALACRRRRRFV